MITIARHIEGICLNPKEYLLDNEGKVILFDTEETAKAHLKTLGVTEEEMYYMFFDEYNPDDFEEEERR